MLTHVASPIVSFGVFLRRRAAQYLILSFTLLITAFLALASSPRAAAQSEPAQPIARDGAHDFDFNIGVWHTHIVRIPDPFSAPDTSFTIDGTVNVSKVWGGRAELEQIEADSVKGHWEAMTLFLYNPTSHQWSQSYLDSKFGDLGSPTVGSFHDGIGELYSSDTFKGRTVLIRGIWSGITPDAHRYEESYSDDGGQTWHLAFQAQLTRAQEADAQPAPTTADLPGQHDFDWNIGAWKVHSTRLLHPLTGSKDWVTMDGYTVVRKIWGGRANMAEYSADGTGGHVVLLGLHWFNPATQQWNIDFANPKGGSLGAIPGVGVFRNGRGDFYDYEPINGAYVTVRFSIWSTGADTAQSEQAFSADGGKTWEVNWINTYTRVPESSVHQF